MRVFITFISIFLFTSCTQEREELKIIPEKIQFGVESVSETRGEVITGEKGENPLMSMSVFCSYTDKEEYNATTSKTEWMHNVRVARTSASSEWVVDEPYQSNAKDQWAGDGYHTFFAIAPYVRVGFSSVSQPGPPQLTFTVPANHAQQTDLLYSRKILLNGKQMYIGGRPVNFGFSHALSKISFAAQKENGMTADVLITSISIANLNNKGILSLSLTGAYPEMIQASWNTLLTYQPPYTLSVENKGLKNLLLTDQVYSLLHAGDSALFLLPQTLQSSHTLKINYSIKDGIDILNRSLSIDLSKISGITQWELGKAYRYSVLIKDDRAIVSGTVSDWVDQPVDGSVKASYLSLSESNIQIKKGTSKIIYYLTDGKSVSVSCAGVNFTHNNTGKSITILDTTPLGNYTIEIRADKLVRNVKLGVK